LAPQGLFQIETETGHRVCQKVKPKNIYDLSAVLAIARPGALAFADDYAKYSNTGEYQSIHPFFDDVLKFTGGIPLYQEELISCARKIGFSADEGEQLRRSSAKKKPEEIAKWKDRIIEKVKENNLDPKIGDILWKLAEDSAGYSFNYSHSLAYATCSFRTIYCKVHYTKEFFLALLRMALNEPDPLSEIFKISQELALFGIKLLPPCLSKSKEQFSIEGKDIRYGLNSLKGISEKSIQNLLDFRGHEFQNKYQIFQSAKDCGLNIGILCTLIQAGCLDSFGDNRCKMVLEAQMFNKLTEKEKLSILELGEHHNHDIFAALKDGAEGKILNAKNKSVFTEKRIEKLREEHSKYKQIFDQNIKHLKFCNWYFEREMLGYSYSYTLRDAFEEKKNTFTPLLEFSSLEDNENIRIVGVVTEVKKTTSKKGNKYMMLSISDEGGKLSAMFGDNAKDNKWSRHLEDKLPVPSEDSVVIVYGKKFGDLLMVDRFSIVEDEIYLKLSNVK
jgi:DNA polymerase-3 subunit alpha